MTSESHENALGNNYPSSGPGAGQGPPPEEWQMPQEHASGGSPEPGSDVTAKASQVAEQGREAAHEAGHQAAEVAGVAAAEAGAVKDAALERGADVAGVAKDELARLTSEARGQLQGIWSQASSQLREQASSGQQQLSELLHSLAGELGEMASRSQQEGPLTALARAGAVRGGEWSHWLANTEPADLLTQVKRFARRRPVLFLASAAAAGIVVGRLSRGLMAAADTPSASVSRPAGVTGSATPSRLVTDDVDYEADESDPYAQPRVSSGADAVLGTARRSTTVYGEDG